MISGRRDANLSCRPLAFEPINTHAMPFDPDVPVTDDHLLADYAAGDARAAAILSQRLLPGVYRLALRMLADAAEAEDVAQEAMLRLWRIAPKWESGQAKVSTWLYRVTANLCTDRLRRRRAVALEDIAEPLDDAKSAVAQMQHDTRMDALQKALADLPERQRQAVVLRHIEGLGNDEISQIMDVGLRAVESLTARGKKALAEALRSQKDALGYTDDA